jgi:hypothetical protein
MKLELTCKKVKKFVFALPISIDNVYEDDVFDINIFEHIFVSIK